MERRFSFVKNGEALTLPVTPAGYEWNDGINVNTINISQAGDRNMPGGRTMCSGAVTGLLPAQRYEFCEPDAVAEPQYYLDRLSAWCTAKEPVRFIVTGELNKLVYLEKIARTVQDATGDVYVTVSMREYEALEAVSVSNLDTGGNAGTGNGTQTAEHSGQGQSYTIVKGDTLSAICRRYYGKGTAAYYNALAKYNNIKNPHLIYPGHTITIPAASVLLGS